MLLTILFGLITLFFALSIDHIFNGGMEIEEGEERKIRITQEGCIRAVILGALVGFSNYVASNGDGWSIFSLIAMAVVLAYLIIWFYSHCTRWEEIAPFWLMVIPIYVVMRDAANAVSPMASDEFWGSVIMALPFIITMGYLFAFPLAWLSAMYEAEKDPAGAEYYRQLRWPALAVLLIVIIVAAIFSIDWDKYGKEPVVEETPVAVSEAAWYYFYNNDVNKDEDKMNDFNFGLNPLEGLVEGKVANGELKLKDIENKSVDEMIALVSVDEIEANFRDRLSRDPALGAADLAWFDASLKTRYLGEFYDECKGEWASTMNSAKVRWMEYQDIYNDTLSAFFKFLDTADKVEVVKVAGGLDDQMYMNPFTVDGVPDIIVMQSLNQQGYFLKYTLNIKGEIKEVAYRIDCGFQPTNVGKIMNLPVRKNPNKKPTIPTPTPTKPDPGKTEGGGGHSSGGGGHHSGGGSKVPVPKDPTKGTDVGPNDTPGPGPDTNNGPGAQHSKAEKPGNSAFMTPKEYKEAVQELKDVAEHQKVAGDPNKPSTPPPTPDTKIDSNADKGTGYGGIDVETPVHDTHVESTAGGGTTSTTDDKPGTEWGGPAD